MNQANPVPFQNSFARLPDRFFSREAPTQVRNPALIRVNYPLADLLGIDSQWLESDAGIQMMAGNSLPEGAEPIATAYAGHQFGGWNPQLGDGRAILLGEVVDKLGRRFDIQLKGSGETPYSRSGDGRSPLGPVLREYIVSEAMAALGVPTTRSLGAVTTGETVYRNRALPGAVLTRVARSHIRVGHFQYFSARQDTDALRLLADHIIARDFPDVQSSATPYADLLQQAISRQTKLIAQWQAVGFIHGVMNTDNMLICGETIDYGPCAFMEQFDPNTCFSSIDHGKRYAYKSQPVIAQWNLSWFAQALLPLLHSQQDSAIDIAQTALNAFPDEYHSAYLRVMHDKFGFAEINRETEQLIEAFLGQMTAQRQDFTLTFRHLADLASNDGQNAVDYCLPESFSTLLDNWRALRTNNSGTIDLRRVNPAYIPRNHQVEAAIVAAEQQGDLAPFNSLVDVLAQPYEFSSSNARYSLPAEPHEAVQKTFCGT
jgi:serine/tyrosine/threonine adenylyltransferase